MEAVKHQCEICLREFRRKDGLAKHVKSIHMRIKNCKCPHCDYACTLPGNLDKHIEVVHSANKPFVCEYCKQTFTHDRKKIHNIQKTKSCGECEYRCKTNAMLDKHVKAIHDKKLDYKCPDCPYTSVTKKELKEHIHFNHTYKKGGSLDDNLIPYQFDQTFARLSKFAGKALLFDFILTNCHGNTCFIEFDGKQEKYETITHNDNIKNNFCMKNNYKLLRLRKSDLSNLENNILNFLF
jgi:hypothetical protein